MKSFWSEQPNAFASEEGNEPILSFNWDKMNHTITEGGFDFCWKIILFLSPQTR